MLVGYRVSGEMLAGVSVGSVGSVLPMGEGVVVVVVVVDSVVVGLLLGESGVDDGGCGGCEDWKVSSFPSRRLFIKVASSKSASSSRLMTGLGCARGAGSRLSVWLGGDCEGVERGGSGCEGDSPWLGAEFHHQPIVCSRCD